MGQVVRVNFWSQRSQRAQRAQRKILYDTSRKLRVIDEKQVNDSLAPLNNLCKLRNIYYLSVPSAISAISAIKS